LSSALWYQDGVNVDIAEIEQHRAALTGHCYRMLGSSADAEDAVQETIVRAWRSLERFEGRSSLRTWLYRIATNVCLDALSDSGRRFRPFEEGPSGLPVEQELASRERTHWLEPIPDARAIPADADPFQTAVLRQPGSSRSICDCSTCRCRRCTGRARTSSRFSRARGYNCRPVRDGFQ
jgi:RNA polymerase sigma factor (sigma-70 family)